MAKRPKLERLTSPKGTARYPKLITPDEYKGQKKFKTELIVDPNDDGVQEFLDRIEEVANEKFEKTKAELQEEHKAARGQKKTKAKKKVEALEVKLPFENEVDDEGEETGNVIVKFAKNAEFKDQKTGEVIKVKVHHFDADGKYIKRPPNVWGGSVLKVASDLYPFYNDATDQAGVSMRLQGVQIIELVLGGGASAESMGFGKEDGYTATDLDDDSDNDTSDDGEDDDDPDF